ncbi:sugar ABC transporter substrate-binding protein [Jeotgalibacillus soli]|uniref:Ribose ABC transporter ribose-binding protein n=1 Tax=Jeotgalibacillus soli TaxID=889306 RepID=A0A0C2S6S6_9BACL|nr:sugar ABC transporter substrate-binding protein [Jeotgalibacillus soli]KIL49739.1 ribose ABC transporter ribose-binding protein [Jeotgalibacillus soli]
MGTKRNSWILALILLLTLALAACQPQGETGEEAEAEDTDAASTAAETEEADHPLAGKKVALIMQINLGTFSAQYIAGVEEQVEKFGGQTQVFTSDGDLAKMASNIDAAINQQFDAILIDHGTKEALQDGVNRAVEAGIAVVAFDADLEGITVLEQGDQDMANMTLGRLAEDFDGEANIVKIWVAGFAPMERRQIAYQQFLQDNPGINEVAAFGAATQNTALDTQAQVEAVLKQYPNEGDIDAIWASWDEFAKGAVRALEQAGRTDIKVYGIDMSDEDLQMMQQENSPWVASAAVDPTDIGRIQVRYAYQQLNEEGSVERVLLEPVFVEKEALPDEQITTEQLSEYVDGWGASDQGYTEALQELEAAFN